MGAPSFPDYDGAERMGGKVAQDLKMGRRTTSKDSAPESQSYANGGVHRARTSEKPFGGKVKPGDISGFAQGGTTPPERDIDDTKSGGDRVQSRAQLEAEGEGLARGGEPNRDAPVQSDAELAAEGERGGISFHGGTHHHYHTGRKRGGPVGREHHDMGGATGPAVPAGPPQAAPQGPPNPRAAAALQAVLAIKRRQAMARPTPAAAPAAAPAPTGRPMMSRGGEKC